MNIAFKRRHVLQALAALAGAPLLGASALAQTGTAVWPSKPIRLVVPFPPAGPTDTVARVVSQKLSERLQQPVVVENRPGASGSIAAAQIAKSEPDGYTLMMLANPTLIAPLLYKSVRVDMAKDFTPIATMYDVPLVLVVNANQLPDVTNLQKLITHAKAQKVPLSYTSAGVGSFGHLSMELLKQTAGFDMQHVPYKGAAPAVADTIAGQVPIMFADMMAVLPHIQAGKLRAIAVGSAQRVSMVPEVKTVAEQGINGYSAVSWGGLLAPPGIPKNVADRLGSEVRQILAEKQTQDKLLAAGVIVRFENAEKMRQRMQLDYTKWGQVIRDKGIAVE
ncbi:tripartite tricarboxylate transporter substrate binding protein [Cupriavidus necator]|uniref:Tripartite tricarboxylate transporter substrate binding protein n=1 Tax=Cupriavidus necator TaxID=106590 RepID=A0A367PG17_CUPNE|nr:tripartite tricarboxylate transporter substrate binding protein [Cupriavidus necator]QQX86624.1 tripartite tricarboxylate transporter substrate binding protein [Cupriavidus necator]RCJ06820.1 tripartite tricarboxylate transporter substrate binding protein [Cupriavidus necator]